MIGLPSGVGDATTEGTGILLSMVGKAEGVLRWSSLGKSVIWSVVTRELHRAIDLATSKFFKQSVN